MGSELFRDTYKVVYVPIDYVYILVFIMFMTHPLEIAIGSNQCVSSQQRIADADQNAEDVSAIASEENQKILAAMDVGKQCGEEYVDANVRAAMDIGIHAFNLAQENIDPNFISDLSEGINALVARVHQQAEAGVLIPMDYMNPLTRKQLFLLESATRSIKLSSAE